MDKNQRCWLIFETEATGIRGQLESILSNFHTSLPNSFEEFE